MWIINKVEKTNDLLIKKWDRETCSDFDGREKCRAGSTIAHGEDFGYEIDKWIDKVFFLSWRSIGCSAGINCRVEVKASLNEGNDLKAKCGDGLDDREERDDDIVELKRLSWRRGWRGRLRRK